MAPRISLAQQIALLSEAAPADFDPEDLNPQGDHSEGEAHEDATSAAREHYIDVGPSSLRLANQQSISDPKYAGTRVSRKDLEHLDEDEEIESDEDEEEEVDEEAESDEGEEHDASEHEDADGDLPQADALQSKPTPSKTRDEPAQQEQSSDLASTLRATREQDRRKGKAVARQISVWDTLLDARIRLQKTAAAVNHLTANPIASTSRQQEPVQTSMNAMLDEALALSQDLFQLQETLARADASPAYPPRKRAKLSHESEHDYAGSLTALSATASEFEAAYHPYLVQTLAKWSAKVQAVAPNVLLPANRGSFKNAFAGKSQPPNVVEVIADTLRTDAEKLLARTRTNRLAADDDVDDAEKDVETFDDSDFYQQLLRDIIEARGAGRNGDEAEPEWIRRQKANKAKRKKTVDVKASKGRKLRYQVHEKLQNFMVPIAVSRGAWHDEQIDELFASILGGASA